MVDFKNAKELRIQGKTYREISDTIGCSISWCKVNLKNVKIPKPNMPTKKCDLSRLLEGSLESFYWLGFLMADGHFSDKNRLQIMLSIKDEKHLLALQDFLKVEKINYRKTKGNMYVGLSAMDTSVIKAIKEKYKILSCKTESPCDISSLHGEELFSLSIGFIDGDGCIDRQYKRETAKLRVKCHKSWEDNLRHMYPDALISLNKQGYACASITASAILKNMKLRAECLNLPIMLRKWNLIDTTYISRYERSKFNMPIIQEMLEIGYTQQYIGDLLGYHSSSLSVMIKRNNLNVKHVSLS